MNWMEKVVFAAIFLTVCVLAFDAFGQSLYPGHPNMTHFGQGHFYDHACCDRRDCRPVKPGEVKRHDTLPGWVHIPTGTFMHDDDILRKIPDRALDSDKYQSHICFYLRDFEGEGKQKGMVRYTSKYDNKGKTVGKNWCFYPARPLL